MKNIEITKIQYKSREILEHNLISHEFVDKNLLPKIGNFVQGLNGI